ncbi:uncharacterized protein LOC141642886 [Silene latifolia]|uniref:uncharacterized protein LOC141642886 n=1 Tax=Silene latifolia TaxID=37657 RepID=UPI003D7833D8
MIVSKGDPSMYKPREKSTGWAAFDHQQRRQISGHSPVSSDPFPSLSSTLTLFQNPEKVSRNKQLSMKPFSSVVGSPDFEPPAQDNSKSRQSEIGNSSGILRETSGDTNFDEAFRWLKQQYTWADANLIDDIMVAADNDPNIASSFLKAMISDNVLKDSRCRDSVNNVKTLPGKVLSSMEASAGNHSQDGNSDFTVLGEMFSDNLVKISSILGQLTSVPVPVEPEWEDDDLYLSCRKDAIKMMRAATHHSKAATNSFQRGDHYSAQQFSFKAQEEWESANRLNAKAAREILSIRNECNGIWRLDLHGLHASEAVQALREHLHKIEIQLYLKGSSSLGLPNDSRTNADVLHASSLNGDNKMDKIREQALCGPNLKWLEVITGIGNHSRGGAALPTAVKTFLVDNGYRIDEARPGVVMVRPKFR